MAAPQDQDPRDLHSLAVDCQTDVQKLATGLAHAGASPQAVQTLTKMAEVLSQVVKVIGQGQNEGAPSMPQPQGQPPQAQPPQPGPQQQPPAPAQPPQPGPQQHSLLSATHALHAAMQQSAQRR